MKLKMTWQEGFEPRCKEGDAGIDLRVYSDIPKPLEPGQVTEIDTGVCVEFPEGHFGMVFPRSSTGRDGLFIVNTIPVVDESYTGRIILYVSSRVPMTLTPAERFAQMVIVPYYQVTEIKYGTPRETDRGDGSFGSTGKV